MAVVGWLVRLMVPALHRRTLTIRGGPPWRSAVSRDSLEPSSNQKMLVLWINRIAQREIKKKSS